MALSSRWLLILVVLLTPVAGDASPLRSATSPARRTASISSSHRASLHKKPTIQLHRPVAESVPQRPLFYLHLRSLDHLSPSVRARLEVLAARTQYSRQLLHQLSEPLQRSERFFLQPQVGDISTASLLLASASKSFRFAAAGARFAGPISGIGSVGLGLHSMWQLLRAKTRDKRIEALHGLAWSFQGLGGLGYLLRNQGAWIEPTAQAFGVAGGMLQTALGIRRIVRGRREGDRSGVILGGLDVGAGLCWVGSTLSIANPYSIAGFIGFSLAQMGYKRRDKLKTIGMGCVRKTKRGWAKAHRKWHAYRARKKGSQVPAP